MTSIQTHKVGEHGPYAYRVTWEGTADEHEWEYLGPVGKVDPEDLTEDETAELREEGFALARFREGTAAELHFRDIANSFRDDAVERWGEDVLAPTDDRRMTEVQLSESAPPAAERLLSDEAVESQAAIDAGTGQAPLSDDELKAIDWSKPGQNVPHARTAKAALSAEGISDWRILYSGDIESDGWDDVADRNRESMQGERTDGQEERQTRETSTMEARSKMEEKALEAVADGYEEAREPLIEEHGWSDEDIDDRVAEMQEVPR